MGLVEGRSPAAGSDFDGFYRAEWPGAVRLAHLLTGVDATAEDLAQEAFARVHRHWSSAERPGALLRVTLVNVCRSWHRGRGREQARLARVGVPEPVPGVGEGSFHPFDHLDLLGALDDLPYRQKAVLVLRYYHDLPETEIAAALGCRPGTVKSLAARGLERLRQVIDR